LRVTAVTSNRERSYTLHIAAGLSLLTAAVLEACACNRIDLARNRFFDASGQAVKTAQPLKSTLYPLAAYSITRVCALLLGLDHAKRTRREAKPRRVPLSPKENAFMPDHTGEDISKEYDD
jgi:hypothetical protein